MKNRLGIALIALFAGCHSVEAASFGNTVGQYGISQIGSAQYSIPIWLPPGVNGLQPKLTLNYDSQSGDGILGPGWNLGGLSQITRCNLTYAQDGTPGVVTLTLADRFCLDGQKLRLTSSENLGNYGSPQSFYQTEIANFSRVGASTQTAGNGPSFFTVSGKDGLTYEYGATTDSKIFTTGGATPYAWALDKVTDRVGNVMTFTYTQTNGAFVMSSIQYGAGNNSTAFLYQVKFVYTTLTLPKKAVYIAGTQVEQTQQLSTITVLLNGTTTDLRVYNLTYAPSPTTGRETLITIQECGGASGTDCLLPTSVTYQGAAPGVASPATATGSGTTNGTVRSVDIDGDGRQDLVFATTNSSGNYVWWVQFASSTGYGTPVNTGAISFGTTNVIFDDFDASGKVEILAPSGGVFYAYKWNAGTSSFVATSTGVPVVTNASYASADVDGDGRPDLAYIISPATTISVYLNTTVNTAISFTSAPVTTTLPTSSAFGIYGNNSLPNSPVQHFDFDGDGRQDFILFTASAGIQTISSLISRGTGPFLVGAGQKQGAVGDFMAVNWNDDACTDLIVENILILSQCDGVGQSRLTLPVAPSLALDWDGDGRTDVLANVGGVWQLYQSVGNTYAPAVSTGISVGGNAWFVTDTNGDGLDDLLIASGTSQAIYFGLHNGSGVKPDLATSFKDGYGNSASPAYGYLTQSSLYTNSTNAPVGYENYIGPFYVVSQTTFSDPSNAPSGTYTQTMSYSGAWINLQGRGFSGFAQLGNKDSRNGVLDIRDYREDFPFTGILSEELISQPNNTLVFTLQMFNTFPTLAAATLDATTNNQRYFPYVLSSTASNYELGGAEDGQLTSTTVTNWTYDNYGNATNVSRSVTDNDPASPYLNDTWTSVTATTIAPDTTTWCLNVPTEIDVTNTPPPSLGAPAITRHTSYTPDSSYIFCRETQQVVESGNSNYQVTTAYSYDGNGNLNGQTVTGIQMTARATAINWDTTGHFPISIKNALNQSTLTSFDPNTGKLLSVTDPNGIVTSWQYDDFARKTKEVQPDATSTTWSYNNCATGGCVNANNQMTLVQTAVNKDGTTLNIQNTYFDALSQPLVTSQQMLNGAYDRNEIQYDSLGRVHQQAAPCTFVSCTYYWTVNTYDGLNRLLNAQRPISATNPTLQTTNYLYQGRTLTITDAQQKVTYITTKVTGDMGRTKDNNGYYVNFSHDAFGSVLSVTDSLSNTLRTMTYAYGVKAFPLTLNDMDLGTRSWTPDALGEVTAYSDGKGQSFSALYDALSRPTNRTEPDLSTAWTWGTTAASFNIGKLATVTSTATPGTHSDAYTYDSSGRLTDHTIINPVDGSHSFDYAYDSNTGLLTTLTYPISYASTRVAVGYTYSNGILQQVFNLAHPTYVWWKANTVNARGQVTQDTTEDLSGDPKIVTNRAFDAVTGWLGSIQAGVNGGSALQNQSYTYDYLGNVTQRQDGNAGLTENVYYDSLYRLDHSTLGGTTNLQMTYDLMGNITSRSDVASGATWTYDPVRKHAVTQAGNSSFTYLYDANGNATARNGSTIAWTTYNYPSGVGTSTESATFDYGPDRQRWRMIYTGPSGVETTYYATPMFEVVHTSGTDYRHYIYAGGRAVVVVIKNSAGETYDRSLLVDHIGSVAAIVSDVTGTNLVNESFTAYGNRREASTWSGAPTSAELTSMNAVTREGYTFQTVLGSMGLTHMNGRVEDAVTGRFLSPDPYTFGAENTQSSNRYSYVNNNPLTYVDPSGFDCTFSWTGHRGQDGTAVPLPSDSDGDPVVADTTRWSVSCSTVGDFPDRSGEGQNNQPKKKPIPTKTRDQSKPCPAQPLSRQGLNPTVQQKADSLLDQIAAAGLNARLGFTFRSVDQQNQLFAQGRSAPGPIVTNARGGDSLHNYGLAFDILMFDSNGNYISNGSDSAYSTAGQLGQGPGLGLTWGGTWTSPFDPSHFQFTNGLSLQQIQNNVKSGQDPLCHGQ